MGHESISPRIAEDVSRPAQSVRWTGDVEAAIVEPISCNRWEPLGAVKLLCADDANTRK